MPEQNEKLGFIFDLDQTLFDTEIIKPYRDTRKWQKALTMASSSVPDRDIVRLISLIKEKGYQIAIVTRSPRIYAEIFARKLGIVHIVAYHDVKNRYNKIEGYEKAALLMGVANKNIIVVGDDDKALDMSPVTKLEMTGVQARWYSNRTRNTEAKFCCETIQDLIILIQEHALTTRKGGL